MLASLEGIVEPKTLAIMRVLLSNSDKLFHLNSLAESSKVPLSSTSRIIKRLVKSDFASETKVGKISVYKLAKNSKVRQIRRLK